MFSTVQDIPAKRLNHTINTDGWLPGFTIILNPLGDLSKLALLHTLDPKLRLLRQNYLMLQYQETQIWEKLNLMIRCTINLDDTSSQFITIFRI